MMHRNNCLGLAAGLWMATFAFGVVSIPEEIALGDLLPAVHEISIPITNRGADARISQVNVDCDCLTIEPPPISLRAGSESHVRAVLDLRRSKPGRLARLLTFHIEGTKHFTTISGSVSPSRNWRFEEKLVTTAEPNRTTELVGSFLRHGDRRVSIVSVTSPARWLAASPRQTAMGVDVVYSIGPDLPEGRSRAKVTIRTDDPDEPHVVQLVEIQVPETFRLDPQARYVADAEVGRRATITLHSDRWDSAQAPIFVIDGTPAEILQIDRDAAAGGCRWQIGVYPSVRGISEKKIRVFRSNAELLADAPCLAELTVMLRALE